MVCRRRSGSSSPSAGAGSPPVRTTGWRTAGSALRIGVPKAASMLASERSRRSKRLSRAAAAAASRMPSTKPKIAFRLGVGEASVALVLPELISCTPATSRSPSSWLILLARLAACTVAEPLAAPATTPPLFPFALALVAAARPASMRLSWRRVEAIAALTSRR